MSGATATGDGVKSRATEVGRSRRTAPMRVATLSDGNNEGYGLASAVANVLEANDASRVHTIGLFFNRGIGYRALASRFVDSHSFDIGQLLPLRRDGGPKFDPLLQSRRLIVFLRAVPSLRRWFRDHPAPICHLHDRALAWVHWRATRGMPIERVWQCHGVYPYPPGGSASARFVRFARRAVRRIIAISRFVASTFPEELRERVRVVHDGVSVARLRREARPGEFRARYGLRPDQPLIGIFGSIIPIKGHVYFLEAAARVAQRFPDARFAIVGDVIGVYRRLGGLDNQIRRLDLQDRVIQTGFLPDATRHMPDFDVIAMPSIWTPHQAGEGFGMVMIEAMALGVATVATNCGAPPEVITDGVDGLLVPPKDSDSLAAAMTRLLSDASMRRSIGEAGARTVAERFDSRIAAMRLASVYEELVEIDDGWQDRAPGRPDDPSSRK